jgi:type II secretory pathway pseudopilin PulG
MNEKSVIFSQKKNRGQVWVETVIYTLIALVMIGAVLAFAVPKVQQIQDKAVIEQSINSINDINNVVLSVVQGGAGNKRIVEANIKKGLLKIDGVNNKIDFEMETGYVYSEPGKNINLGDIQAITEKVSGAYKVTLTASYNYNITYNGNDEEKSIDQSPVPYKIIIENKGDVSGNTWIDMKLG